MSIFVYDRLIHKEEFCNFSKEQSRLLADMEAGRCVRIFAPRNFGKTSLVKNIVAADWEKRNDAKRIVVYADFYSVQTIDEFSQELTNAFNKAISAKRTLFDKSVVFLKLLTKVRPTWKPPLDAESFGEFSLRTESDSPVVPFATVLENIDKISRSKEYECAIIFDEFQEIAKIPRLSGKLRDALQNLSRSVPVMIMGSKHHLLKKIFDTPNAPFHGWGNSLSLEPIPYDEYTAYANERFQKVGKILETDASRWLQDELNRIPEAMNRFCDYLATKATKDRIGLSLVQALLVDFMEDSRSIYSSLFADLSTNERAIMKSLAKLKKVKSITGREFLSCVKIVSKSGLPVIVEKLLDRSLVMRAEQNGDYVYQVADPLFGIYLRKYQPLM